MRQEEGITELLEAPGKLADSIDGMSGTRNLDDNLSDLRAQVIAHHCLNASCENPMGEYTGSYAYCHAKVEQHFADKLCCNILLESTFLSVVWCFTSHTHFSSSLRSKDFSW